MRTWDLSSEPSAKKLASTCTCTSRSKGEQITGNHGLASLAYSGNYRPVRDAVMDGRTAKIDFCPPQACTHVRMCICTSMNLHTYVWDICVFMGVHTYVLFVSSTCILKVQSWVQIKEKIKLCIPFSLKSGKTNTLLFVSIGLMCREYSAPWRNFNFIRLLSN